MGKLIYFGKKKLEYYNNILIKADLGLHDQIFSIISKSLPKGSRVLDVGAGEGALSQRLVDHGYEVYSLDTDAKSFQCQEAHFTQIDFDSENDFENYIDKHNNFFDCAICVEVIEHVENQWDLSRSIQKMLKPGGEVIFSTPNITSWYSRLYFLFKGKFHQFDLEDLSYGHIAPISKFHLQVIFEKTKWKDIQILEGGTLPPVWLEGSFSLFLLNLFALLLRPLQRGVLNGWCLILHAKK